MEVMHPHFNYMFNSKKQVDFSILEHVTKLKVMHFFCGDITFTELKKDVTNLKTHKPPGSYEVPPEALKTINDKCLKQVLK
jgi:hypothetical protein